VSPEFWVAISALILALGAVGGVSLGLRFTERSRDALAQRLEILEGRHQGVFWDVSNMKAREDQLFGALKRMTEELPPTPRAAVREVLDDVVRQAQGPSQPEPLKPSRPGERGA